MGNSERPEIEILRSRVAELEKVEQQLRESERRFKYLFEYAPDGYYLTDLRGVFIDGNKAAEGIVGYEREELIGKSFLNLKLLSAGQMPRAVKLLARNALRQATGPDEFVLTRKDGERITVEISTFPTKMDGKIVVLGIARDISKRKEDESELLDRTSRIIHVEKQSAMSEMTARITHELKQPLNAAKIIAQSLLSNVKRDLFDKIEAQEDLVDILAQIRKMSEIIDNMMVLIRPAQILERTGVNLNDLMEGALSLVGKQIRNGSIDLSFEPDADLPPIQGDPVRLEQVFLNIIGNARHALEEQKKDGKRIAIKTYVVDGGAFVACEIEDNGPGIPGETVEKIFEPFFTTKKPEVGTGLGLSISNKIVKEHKGHIEVKSTVGKGTTFRVMLPIRVQVP